MASIEKRGRSYRIVFRLEGRKYSRALQTTNERDATTSLVRLEDNLRRVSLGTLTIPEGADVATFLLSDGKTTAHRRRCEIHTIIELFDAYFASIPVDCLEQSTLTSMHIHQGHFVRILGAGCRIQSLQTDDLQRYIEIRAGEPGLRGKRVSTTTIKRELTTLTTVWNWANSTAIVGRPLPKKWLHYPKTVEKPRFQTWEEIERKIARGGLTAHQEAELWDCLFLTNEQIEQLLVDVRRRARHAFIHPLFVFAAHTGARRSEMMRSQIEDIDFRGRCITIREKKRVRGRHTVRNVPMSEQLQDTLRTWIDVHPGTKSTFCRSLVTLNSRSSVDHVSHLTRDDMAGYFRRALAGTEWEKLRGWHVFRHSFCSNCAAAGVDQRVINAWVGHQTEEMVKRYRHLIPNQEQQAIQQVFGKANCEGAGRTSHLRSG